jgi:hypothetical protein
MIDLLVAEYGAPGELIETIAHEHAQGAVVRRYSVPEGAVLVTMWRGVVHEVIYQTPCETDEESAIRNDRLFVHYGEGQQWNEILDNGFGKTYRRADLERFALWSYVMDIVTFGTMAFHEIRWR